MWVSAAVSFEVSGSRWGQAGPKFNASCTPTHWERVRVGLNLLAPTGGVA
ncbi:hypothetical protein E2C01_079013 [Portunus trituberculatus]|uniref:Uncharacterized protein n=1 Tax=Portunus trituberculatus TaxID=210409 RepID=A0A5B7IIJ8_PORTR|nr:hypothetical protein [Portunus trituberculatus]